MARVRFEYLLVPLCERESNYAEADRIARRLWWQEGKRHNASEFYGDPFDALVPEGEPEPVTDCPKCGKPRWIPRDMDLSQCAFNVTPIGDSYLAQTNRLRIEVSIDGHGFRPSPIADIRVDGMTATASAGLPPAIQCDCWPAAMDNNSRCTCNCGAVESADISSGKSGDAPT